MRLTFELRRSYGVDRYYPANEASRLIVESLLKRKCLESHELELLTSAGASIVFDRLELEPGEIPESYSRVK